MNNTQIVEVILRVIRQAFLISLVMLAMLISLFDVLA